MTLQQIEVTDTHTYMCVHPDWNCLLKLNSKNISAHNYNVGPIKENYLVYLLWEGQVSAIEDIMRAIQQETRHYKNSHTHNIIIATQDFLTVWQTKLKLYMPDFNECFIGILNVTLLSSRLHCNIIKNIIGIFFAHLHASSTAWRSRPP